MLAQETNNKISPTFFNKNIAQLLPRKTSTLPPSQTLRSGQKVTLGNKYRPCAPQGAQDRSLSPPRKQIKSSARVRVCVCRSRNEFVVCVAK
ncbi:hypothetical protein JTE90_000285 [Oedothorax gibbosus]|uniref:Uncharacterized protein n=1 Tax=Oedothorax gibbosus TaxID=931172 RepID=A0AAV6VRW9_9ARAC|nr:hypothetical protein JTE90_000285 [Oedothorax gibbosus]